MVSGERFSDLIMANPKHLKILKQGVEVWNRWREENPAIIPSLASARLEAADLKGANFRGADLRGARLRDANLVCADFRGASLVRSDLSNADLDRSFMGYTELGDIDLSGARYLERIHHSSNSTIGVDALYRSHGEIPEIFLRGVGLPEDFIRSTRGLFGKTSGFYSSFISYSHANSPIAHRLHDQLQSRGVRCWLDEHDLKPGDRILDNVNEAIRLHDKILLCCSEASLESWWVKDEIRKAMERERAENRDIIIPLMADRYLLDGWEDGLAADLRSRLAADFTGWERDNAKFEEQFERVVQALRTDEGASGGGTGV